MIRTTRDGDRWNLQTALVHLRHRQSGRRVRLMSMIHIGEAVYYTRLNEILAEHKGLVLFEGLGQLSEDEIAALTPDERKVYDTIAPLNAAYRTFAAALDLVAQPDALMKPEANWVRADLPLKRLLKLWAERRLPLLPAMEAAGKALDSVMFKRTARFLLLQEPLILGVFRLVRGASPGIGRLSTLLVDERNEAALQAFDATPAEQDVILVYGAGHVPGLLTALGKRGFRETGCDWFTAHSERIALSNVLDVATEWFRPRQGRRESGAGGR